MSDNFYECRYQKNEGGLTYFAANKERTRASIKHNDIEDAYKSFTDWAIKRDIDINELYAFVVQNVNRTDKYDDATGFIGDTKIPLGYDDTMNLYYGQICVSNGQTISVDESGRKIVRAFKDAKTAFIWFHQFLIDYSNLIRVPVSRFETFYVANIKCFKDNHGWSGGLSYPRK